MESTNVFDLAADKTDLAVSLESGQIEIWQKLGGQKKVVIQGLSHGLKIGLAKSFIVGKNKKKFSECHQAKFISSTIA